MELDLDLVITLGEEGEEDDSMPRAEAEFMTYTQVVEVFARIKNNRENIFKTYSEALGRVVIDGSNLPQLQQEWLKKVRKFLVNSVDNEVVIAGERFFVNEREIVDKMLIALAKRNLEDRRLVEDFVSAYLDDIFENMPQEKGRFSKLFVDEVERLCLEALNKLVVNCGKKPIVS